MPQKLLNKIHLVENPKIRWKYYSVRVQLFMAALMAAWMSTPDDTQAQIVNYLQQNGLNPAIVPLIGFILAVITQFINQVNLLPEEEEIPPDQNIHRE